METTKKQNKFRSLTVTLALSLLALSTAILFFIIGFEIYFQFLTQRSVVSSQQQIISRDAANTVKNFVQDKITILETAANLSNFTTLTSAEQAASLEKLIGKETSFRQLVLFDQKGKELTRVSRLSSFEPSQLEKAIGSDFLPKVKRGEVYIGSVYIDNNTSEPLVAMIIPLKNVFGDFQGALVAEVNLKFMWDLVGSIKIGETGQAYVVDKKGRLLAYEDISRVLAGENLNKLTEVAAFTRGTEVKNEVTGAKGIQGTNVIVSHISLGTPDWAVVVELPVSEAYQPLFAVVRISIMIMLVSLILVIIVSIYFSRRITEPLVKLRDASLAISSGNLDTRIEVSAKNEIGELAQTFNDMMVKLKQSYTILEQKVAERTKELEEAKRGLETVNVDLETKVKERTIELEKLKNNLEAMVAQRTTELNQKMEELERVNKLMLGREMKMIELKKEVAELKGNSGDEQPQSPSSSPPLPAASSENSANS